VGFPPLSLALGAITLGLSVYALATDDSPETEQAVNDLLTASAPAIAAFNFSLSDASLIVFTIPTSVLP
jgi:hypothetical protein